MKLKNISKDIQKVLNLSTNWESLVGPNEIIEIEKPLFNKRYFKIINEKEDKK